MPDQLDFATRVGIDHRRHRADVMAAYGREVRVPLPGPDLWAVAAALREHQRLRRLATECRRRTPGDLVRHPAVRLMVPVG